MEQMYSLQTAAKLLDISVKTVRRLVHKHGIKTYRVGTGIRISQADLEKLVQPVKSINEKCKEVMDGIN
ncbi:helix-turn-helix domain-containing protein [bacterium]|nr:helix-turn-helix domain-containing protein [bacterium]MBU1873704.1 helix-turn-helix domain-containing protein [bacterium]